MFNHENNDRNVYYHVGFGLESFYWKQRFDYCFKTDF